MTELDMEIQELRRENAKLVLECKKAVRERQKMEKELEKLRNLRYADLSDSMRFKRQIECLVEEQVVEA